MIGDDMSVFLDSGSATPHVLPPLAQKRNITVVVAQLAALVEASGYPSLHIIALGGVL
jgi:DeoR family myo-inositol catabolism operon transcriptional repressor